MRVWEDLTKGETAINENGDSLFLEYLLKDEELREYLDESKIRECFNYD